MVKWTATVTAAVGTPKRVQAITDIPNLLPLLINLCKLLEI